MSAGKTISEKILSAKSGRDARAGDIVVCDVDLVIGTDASSPMAIGYFEKMGGTSLRDPAKVIFALDHYSPPSTPKTAAFHATVRAFARKHGAELHEVGEGISHQIVIDEATVMPGDLVIGADSHTVTCGALNLFATGVGSSDLAAAMLTGQIWLRVPATIKVVLTGALNPGVTAKDVALMLVGLIGGDGASSQTLEFHGSGVAALSLDDRLVLANLAVEMDAKAAIFPADAVISAYLTEHGRAADAAPVDPDDDAIYDRKIALDLSTITPRVALPHAPDNVVPLADAVGTPVQMVFIGTCTNGRADDFRDALRVIQRAGGTIAPGVQLVITPASRDVFVRLIDDGTIAAFASMGAVITTPGCGACCGTSGVIPSDGMSVLSTANRNFKARMGNGTASIYLASPAACGAAAVAGKIVAAW